MSGRAVVFPSLQSIQEKFALFYDLFSPQGVTQGLYQVYVHEAEGIQIRPQEQLLSAIPAGSTRLLQKTALSRDLEDVFRKFFSSISGDSDPEMLAECFVETKESREADDNLQKIAQNIINNIDIVDASRGQKLSDEIKVAIESHRGDFVLIIGNKGSGKTTFVDRFFRIVLDRGLRDHCLLIRADLADAPNDVAGISSWLTSRIKSLLENTLFHGKSPTWDQLRGVFFEDYDRWRNGEIKHLFNSNETEFKIRFGEWIAELILRDPLTYVKRLLESAVRQRKLMPCLVFDNTDHFPQNFQDAVFQYAQSLHRSVSFSFLICPITDRTIWQLSKSGPLQSYDTRALYLPVPSAKEVLTRRVAFIKKKLNEAEPRKYFTDNAIRLSIPDINAFAETVEDIFVNEEYVGRIIGWLSNHDIRRSLKIAERIITSPIISLTDLVSAYVGGERSSPRPEKIKKALLRGQYNHFTEEGNAFVLNLFAVRPTGITTPLLRLSVLRLLKEREVGQANSPDSYINIRDITNYFESAGIAANITRDHLRAMLAYRLIQPYDPTDEVIADDLQVRITYAGKIHYEFAFDRSESTYLSEMATITPIREGEALRYIAAVLHGGKMYRLEWEQLCKHFVDYCLDEDYRLVTLPTLPAYEGQRQMRRELERSWRIDFDAR